MIRAVAFSVLALLVTACGTNHRDRSVPEAPPPAQTRIGGLDVGSAAPDFTLPQHAGGTVALADLRAKGPVVVVFYRGDWCSICRRQLEEMGARETAFTERGASLVAVSVDPVETSAALAERLNVRFPLLTDADMATIRAYDVEHEGEDFARPATYVLDADGKIVWAWVGERAGDRPALEHILAAIPS